MRIVYITSCLQMLHLVLFALQPAAYLTDMWAAPSGAGSCLRSGLLAESWVARSVGAGGTIEGDAARRRNDAK